MEFLGNPACAPLSKIFHQDSNPIHARGRPNEGGERAGPFVRPQADAPPSLQPREQPLDSVPLTVKRLLANAPRPRILAIFLAGNDRPGVSIQDDVDHGVGVVGLVGAKGGGRMKHGDLGEPRAVPGIRPVASGQDEVEQAALRVRNGMDFGRESSAAVSQLLPLFRNRSRLLFLRAPAAQAAALQTVESMKRMEASGLASSSCIRLKTPRLASRKNRQWTLLNLPK